MTNVKSVQYPPLHMRLYSVWFRHMRVYTKNLLSNGLPPFLEPHRAEIEAGLKPIVVPQP